ncbi:MAG: hypothetical protein J6Z41_01130 [Prevotella sp.]|nr:hypothetical protein [Prevotella sp.]
MDKSSQVVAQIERFVRKVIQKFPPADEPDVMTDIHVRAIQESGELRAYDDDDNEVTRCVVEQWIDNKDETFYDEVTSLLRGILTSNSDTILSMGLLKPFSFVLENDDKESVAELFLADDDTIILGGDIMPELDKELDDFFKKIFN